MADLISISRTFDYHVIAISETWFRNDSVPNIDGYSLYRKNRQDGRRGGGVAIYIADVFSSHEVNQFYTNLLEQVWVSVKFNNKHILIGCKYRPNDASLIKYVAESFKLAHSLIKKPYDDCLIVGDFNLPNIKWSNDGIISFNPTILPSMISGLFSKTAFLHNISHFLLSRLIMVPQIICWTCYLPITINKTKKKYDPWVTPHIKNLIRAKKSAWHINCSTKWENSELKIKYNRLNRSVKAEIFKAKKDRIRSLKNTSRRIIEALPDIVDLLNSQFESMFTLESSENFPLLNKSGIHSECIYNENLDFSIPDIIQELADLNPYKSFGFDDLHPLILKICSKSFAIPLTKIFHESFNSGVVPSQWKLANISPIYKKKGDKLLAENYRPISLTSVAFNKELDKLTQWFKSNKLSLNIAKTKYTLFHCIHKKENIPLKLPNLFIDKNIIKREIFGVILDENITWREHISVIEN
ncbi:uncharacterized protein LOC136073907 [Hydra vulgaris]|uniref:uncharacterized protein LOC136073907 n=1 Tax=Hydra vulgaris TaxID=6087 RepID=UPI0032EA5299